MWFVFFFCSFPFLLTKSQTTYLDNCELTVSYKELCIEYYFDTEQCFPWETSQCKDIFVSTSKYNCHTYHCNVIILKFILFPLLLSSHLLLFHLLSVCLSSIKKYYSVPVSFKFIFWDKSLNFFIILGSSHSLVWQTNIINNNTTNINSTYNINFNSNSNSGSTNNNNYYYNINNINNSNNSNNNFNRAANNNSSSGSRNNNNNNYNSNTSSSSNNFGVR